MIIGYSNESASIANDMLIKNYSSYGYDSNTMRIIYCVIMRRSQREK